MSRITTQGLLVQDQHIDFFPFEISSESRERKFPHQPYHLVVSHPVVKKKPGREEERCSSQKVFIYLSLFKEWKKIPQDNEFIYFFFNILTSKDIAAPILFFPSKNLSKISYVKLSSTTSMELSTRHVEMKILIEWTIKICYDPDCFDSKLALHRVLGCSNWSSSNPPTFWVSGWSSHTHTHG